MCITLGKGSFSMSQPFFGMQQRLLKMLQVKTTNVVKFGPLEKIPNAFLGIEFWGISRQTFQPNAFGSPFCQKVFDRLTAMNGSPIPDHQDLAWDLTQEQL